jgi:hypothetical protein
MDMGHGSLDRLPIEQRAAYGAEGTGMKQFSRFARRTDVTSRTVDIHCDVRAHRGSILWRGASLIASVWLSLCACLKDEKGARQVDRPAQRSLPSRRRKYLKSGHLDNSPLEHAVSENCTEPDNSLYNLSFLYHSHISLKNCGVEWLIVC